MPCNLFIFTIILSNTKQQGMNKEKQIVKKKTDDIRKEKNPEKTEKKKKKKTKKINLHFLQLQIARFFCISHKDYKYKYAHFLVALNIYLLKNLDLSFSPSLPLIAILTQSLSEPH